MTMSRRFSFAVLLASLGVAPYYQANADSTGVIRNGDTWGESQNQRPYEKGSPATVSGKILSIDNLMVYEGSEPGMQVNLDLGGGEEMRVHLGPQWFVLQNGINLTNGEPLTVVGIKINLESHPTVIAHEVTQGEHTIILRDLSGTPKWNGKKTESEDKSK